MGRRNWTTHHKPFPAATLLVLVLSWNTSFRESSPRMFSEEHGNFHHFRKLRQTHQQTYTPGHRSVAFPIQPMLRKPWPFDHVLHEVTDGVILHNAQPVLNAQRNQEWKHLAQISVINIRAYYTARQGETSLLQTNSRYALWSVSLLYIVCININIFFSNAILTS